MKPYGNNFREWPLPRITREIRKCVLWRDWRFLRRLLEINDGDETQKSRESDNAETDTPADTEMNTPQTNHPAP